MKGVGMLLINFEVNPKGDQFGRSSGFFFWPLKQAISKREKKIENSDSTASSDQHELQPRQSIFVQICSLVDA